MGLTRWFEGRWNGDEKGVGSIKTGTRCWCRSVGGELDSEREEMVGGHICIGR